ncbi:hypothetical protein HUE56_04460 (plasmid) [Azospirillum oryzae]|uniref:ATP-binding protein n=1 Tax=Azospirillum oryzae TaxID=286727 RepID=A0A6N1ANS9_9PROT|nr:hypothetical protein [Azospirillum oryzae]KAA0584527.1 hypothetical protein FZ938_29600 [Azospirillum oryzae]QKS49792.1 hypothetical protein HUE56_04460 [Azospirillum oryzae]GLR79052.1 hypothetical protein GCM10007856_17260 [Azospirillum oryzae]
MASPLSTGGAGTHLESRIVADYLASVLVGGVVRGLPDCVAKSVRVQRAFENEPLDDVIVDAEGADGPRTMRLQAKRVFAFGDNETFNEVMKQAWDTFSSPTFRAGKDRLGVAFGAITGADEHRQTALHWARQSADAGDFSRRLAQRNVGNATMRSFVTEIRVALDKASGAPIDDDTCWRFLRHFVLLHFDFEQGASSRDAAHAIGRLAHALEPGTEGRAQELWQALIDKADVMKFAAGSVNRATLAEEIEGAFSLAGQRRLLPDLQRIIAATRGALDDIRLDIGGITLTRQETIEKLLEATREPAFLEIVGDAGCGKSGLLRILADRKMIGGPVLVLKAGRLPIEPAWEGFARLLGLENDIDTLLSELSCVGSPCLFIDGVDRIASAGEWSLINDLLRAIARSPAAARWSVVVTARVNGLDGYREKLDPEALLCFQSRRFNVDELDEEEISLIAAAHPRLAPLIHSGGRAHALAHRPYLLTRLLRTRVLPSAAPSGALTEIDLMLAMWVDDGGQGETARRRRQDALLELGKRRVANPGRPVRSVGIDPGAVQALVDNDLIREDEATRTVDFVHDIVEDWVLCQVLDHSPDGVPSALVAAGQPLWFLEPVRLHAAWCLERAKDPSEWLGLVNELSAPPLEPRWRRAALSAPLRSTRAAELFVLIAPMLLAGNAEPLRELMVALRTEEVVLNPIYLDATLFPGFDQDGRELLAHYAAAPRHGAWKPFLAWLMPLLPQLEGPLVDETSRVLEVVPRAFQTMDACVLPLFDWLPAAVANWARDWLSVLEADYSDAEAAARARTITTNGGRRSDGRLEDRLRYLLFVAAGGAPDSARSYLRDRATKERHDASDFILANSNLLVTHLPTELVDFLLAVMRRPLDRPSRFRNDWDFDVDRMIEHDHRFFPASHVRPPFLHLLRANPVEGLRLVNGLCNHAVAAWRARQEGRGSTPSAVTICFPWGERTFWGHAQEYMWFRGGSGGPNSIMSALMALEAWMEEQLAAGRNAEDLFRAVLEGNDSMGALGASVSIALAYPWPTLRAALPLVLCPEIWDWDIYRRVVDEGSHVNTMGLPRHRPFLQPVFKRNALPHRKSDVRDLVFYYLFSGDEAIQAAFADRVRELTEKEALREAAESQNDGAVDTLRRDTVQRMLSKANRANWRVEEDPEQHRVLIEYQPPADIDAEAEVSRREYESLTAVMRLSLWADALLKEGRPRSELTLVEALSEAKALDATDLFATARDSNDLLATHRAAAVAGVAAVGARSQSDLDASDLTWCRDVLLRAANMPVGKDSLLIRKSVVIYHPTIYAAAGLAGLVGRDGAVAEDREQLLRLVAHPLHSVVQALFVALQSLWEREPLLCWQAVVLGMRLALPLRSQMPSASSLKRENGEAVWVSNVVDDAIAEYRAGRPGLMPSVPPPWIRSASGSDSGETAGYQRSDTVFLWDFAPIVLFQQPLDHILAVPKHRAAILKLCGELVTWTIDECRPPWADGDDRGGYTPFEWVAGFMEWCAALGALAPKEVDAAVVQPIQGAQEETAMLMMSDFLCGFLSKRFRLDEAPDETSAASWRELCNWVFTHRRAHDAGERDYLARHFGDCVEAILFSLRGRCVIETPWAGMAIFADTVNRWVEVFGTNPRAYLVLLDFLGKAGWGLAPQRTVVWLSGIAEKKRHDARFWDEHGNGEATANLLERLVKEHARAVTDSPELFSGLLRTSDILVCHGVRRAALVEQQLARLAGTARPR